LRANKASDSCKAPKKPPREGQSFARRLLDVEERPAITRSIDIALFALACLLVLYLHVVLFRHSGAFWRDEASTIYSATAPDLGARRVLQRRAAMDCGGARRQR
jgi:hypothetical protein